MVDIVWGAEGQNFASSPAEAVASSATSGHFVLLDQRTARELAEVIEPGMLDRSTRLDRSELPKRLKWTRAFARSLGFGLPAERAFYSLLFQSQDRGHHLLGGGALRLLLGLHQPLAGARKEEHVLLINFQFSNPAARLAACVDRVT